MEPLKERHLDARWDKKWAVWTDNSTVPQTAFDWVDLTVDLKVVHLVMH
jgi:hypothetical protein